MRELFQKTPLSIPKTSTDYYKNKYKTTINTVGGDWFLENTNVNTTPIKRRRPINNNKKRR